MPPPDEVCAPIGDAIGVDLRGPCLLVVVVVVAAVAAVVDVNAICFGNDDLAAV